MGCFSHEYQEFCPICAAREYLSIYSSGISRGPAWSWARKISVGMSCCGLWEMGVDRWGLAEVVVVPVVVMVVGG